MKTIHVVLTDEDQYALSDSSIESWYQNIKDEEEVKVATELMLLRLRVGVSENEINPFSFKCNGDTVIVKKDGKVKGFWPSGLFPQTDALLHRLLKIVV